MKSENRKDQIIRPHIIAEIANAHQGDHKEAIELAKMAAEAGADSIKFQIYFAEELLTTSHPRYEHFKNQAFSKEQWSEIFSSVKALNLPIYADVFGSEALKIGLEFDLQGFKLHSSDLTNSNLLHQLKDVHQKVFLATGGSTILEIQYALKLLLQSRSIQEVALLHGFQAYPTSLKDFNLSRLNLLKDSFQYDPRVQIGFMDHISPDDPFHRCGVLLAIPYGIAYLEKHITRDRSKKGVDYYSSLEPHEFKSFVEDVELAVQAIGDKPESFSESELQYRNTVKKSWVAREALSEGHSVVPDDFIMKRTPNFLAPPQLETLVGRKLNNAMEEEETLSNTHFNHKVLAIIVARSASSRLKNKALLEINGRPTIAHLFERLKLARQRGYVDSIAFCTTTESEDEALVEVASEYEMEVYRGSSEDVLSRMMIAVFDHPDHDLVLRITGDDILVDPEYLEMTVKHHLEKNAHYSDAKELPSGTEVEVFSSSILRLLYELARDSSGSEYLTTYITDNSHQFETASLPVPVHHASNLRLTLDTRGDFLVIRRLLEHMKSIGKEFDYGLQDILDFFNENPGVEMVNLNINQKATPIEVDTAIDWARLTHKPKVSVYITNYNYGRYLKQAIESVLNQSFKDFELILIDDGSTDESQAIMETYRNRHRIRVVYQKNRGLNVANNIAIKLSEGEYLMRLDADDYLNEDALLLLSKELDQNQDLALTFGDYYLVSEDGQLIAEEKRQDFGTATMKDQPPHGACTLIRKSVLLELGGYSEDFNRQDGYDLWIRLKEHHQIKNIPLPVFYYRQHEGSLSKNKASLYETRAKIIERETLDLNVSSQFHLAILPIRDLSSTPLALEKFDSKSLLEKTLDPLIESEYFKKVILTSPNEKILSFAKNQYKDDCLIADLRPEDLARLNTPLEDTVEYLLGKYELSPLDTISIINYEYPFREPFYFEKAINSLYLFQADTVLSVILEQGNFFFHKGSGLVPVHKNPSLRLESDFLYREQGGIHVVNASYFRENRELIGGRTSHLLMDSRSVKSIHSEEELQVFRHRFGKVKS